MGARVIFGYGNKINEKCYHSGKIFKKPFATHVLSVSSALTLEFYLYLDQR